MYKRQEEEVVQQGVRLPGGPALCLALQGPPPWCPRRAPLREREDGGRQKLLPRQVAGAVRQRLVQTCQRPGEQGVRQYGADEQRHRPRGPVTGRVAEGVAHHGRTDVHDAVLIAELRGGLAVVHLVGVERHHHAGAAGVVRPAAAEGLRAQVGDAEGVGVMAVRRVHVVEEVRVHGLQRTGPVPPVPHPAVSVPHALIVAAHERSSQGEDPSGRVGAW